MPTTRDGVEEVRIPLRAAGYRFTAGNRIRVTILTSLWPVLWPSPLPGDLCVFYGGWLTQSRLILPVLAGRRAGARAARVPRRRPPGCGTSAATRGTSPSGGSRRTCSAGRSG